MEIIVVSEMEEVVERTGEFSGRKTSSIIALRIKKTIFSIDTKIVGVIDMIASNKRPSVVIIFVFAGLERDLKSIFSASATKGENMVGFFCFVPIGSSSTPVLQLYLLSIATDNIGC